ncbi:hypothetical protein BDY24DRAFT_375659 [Mrakia frigida]|uniref:uncharacterized protein n=1 Tax=Mrakia frigida TaxID=29902 RepID=UPI003FCBF4E9
MVQFSIPEYARILGLSKGPGPYSLKSTTLAELERLIRMDYDFTQLTDDEKALLTAQFNALYLPSFLNAILSTDHTFEGPRRRLTSSLFGIYTECTRHVEVYARYAREHPTDASDLYVLFAKQMAVLEPTSENTSEIMATFLALEGAMKHQFIQNPSLSQLPSLDLPTRRGLARLSKGLVALPAERPEFWHDAILIFER